MASSDDELIRLLAAGLTYDQAARQIGITKNTVYRRMKQPEFRARVNDERARLADAVIGTVTGAAQLAVARLRAILADDTKDDTAHARAAGILLGSFDKWQGRITPTTVIAATYGGKDVETLSAEEVAEALSSLRAEIGLHLDRPVRTEPVEDRDTAPVEQVVEQPTKAPVPDRAEPAPKPESRAPMATLVLADPEPENAERRPYNPNPAGVSPWRETPWTASVL